MIKIRPLRTRELKQVLNLLERFSDKEFEYSALEKLKQLYVPLQWFSQNLPLSFQFMPAIYVAVTHRKVLGLIWISQDGQKKNRWKIDQLIIDPDEFSYDIGAQLVHYVINRFGAEGVQTFLAVVDHQSDQALSLLKSCGFRHCTRQISYFHDKVSELSPQQEHIQGLRESGNGDKHKLVRLYNDILPVEIRLSLEKIPADFARPLFPSLIDRLDGRFIRRWVVEDAARDLLYGSLDVNTTDFKQFHFRGLVSMPWTDGYEDLLAFAVKQVMKNTASGTLHTQVYEFQKAEIAFLEAAGFKPLQTSEVLVKDYWIPLKDKEGKPSSPLLIFPGKTSPACYTSPP